jgi:hypothetical protein
MLLMIHWWTIVRLTLAVLAFSGTLYLLRDITRPLVTRLIPLHKRMQNGFLLLQRRLTISTNLVIALILAVGLYWGLSKLHQAPQSMAEEPIEQLTPYEFGLIELPETKLEKIIEPEQPIIEEEEIAIPTPTRTPTAATYIQIGAFASELGSQRHRQHYGGSIAYCPYEAVPYKVLLGPFDSPVAARRYQRQLEVSHFVRTSLPSPLEWLSE